MCDYLIFILCFFTIILFRHVLFVSRLMIFKLVKPTRTVFVFSIINYLYLIQSCPRILNFMRLFSLFQVSKWEKWVNQFLMAKLGEFDVYLPLFMWRQISFLKISIDLTTFGNLIIPLFNVTELIEIIGHGPLFRRFCVSNFLNLHEFSEKLWGIHNIEYFKMTFYDKRYSIFSLRLI